MTELVARVFGPLSQTSGDTKLRGYALSLLLVITTTLVIAALISVVRVERIVGIYIIPVMIVSIRWGLWPGIFSALASTALIHVLFTRPGFGFQLQDWDQSVRLAVYILIAVIAARLARNVKVHAEA